LTIWASCAISIRFLPQCLEIPKEFKKLSRPKIIPFTQSTSKIEKNFKIEIDAKPIYPI
jgi:hypothetical protein